MSPNSRRPAERAATRSSACATSDARGTAVVGAKQTVPAWARALVAAWLGLLATVAFVAAPAAFATLARADAGRYVARVFALEAWASLTIALVLLFAEQRRARADAEAGRGSVMSGATLVLLGTVFCTVLGHFAIEPMMVAARAGEGAWSFGALHGASTVLYGIKALAVLALAWRWQRHATS